MKEACRTNLSLMREGTMKSTSFRIKSWIINFSLVSEGIIGLVPNQIIPRLLGTLQTLAFLGTRAMGTYTK